MTQLRNFGVYALPDGNHYVAVRGGGGNFYLFRCVEGLRLPPAFQVTAEGQVNRWFSSGAEWRVEDLADTGQVYGDRGEYDCPD